MANAPLTGDAETDYHILNSGYDPRPPGAAATSSSWSLDSLFSTVGKLTDAAGTVVGAIGANKAAIANARNDAALNRLRLTTGRTESPVDFGATLKQFLPWIVGLVVLAVVAAVAIPLIKSTAK